MRGSFTFARKPRGLDPSKVRRRAGREMYGDRAGDTCGRSGQKARGSAVGGCGTLTSRVATKMRTGVGEGSRRQGNAAVARMAMVGDRGGGSDGDGGGGGGGGHSKHSPHTAGEKKAVHRLIFMRHAESEWNRCDIILVVLTSYLLCCPSY